VDRHRLDTRPDPNFYVDAVPDPDWNQNNAYPHADPTKSLTHVEKYGDADTAIFVIDLQDANKNNIF